MKTKPMDRWYEEIKPELCRQASVNLSESDAAGVIAWFEGIMHQHCAFHEKSRFIKRAIELVVCRAMMMEWYSEFQSPKTEEVWRNGKVTLKTVYDPLYLKIERCICAAIYKVMDNKGNGTFLSSYPVFVEDISRIAWTEIFKSLDKFDSIKGSASFSTYCYKIATNVTKTFLREERRRLNPARRGRIGKDDFVTSKWYKEVSYGNREDIADDEDADATVPKMRTNGGKGSILDRRTGEARILDRRSEAEEPADKTALPAQEPAMDRDEYLLQIYDEAAAFVERQHASFAKTEAAIDISRILNADPDSLVAAKSIVSNGLWPFPNS